MSDTGLELFALLEQQRANTNAASTMHLRNACATMRASMGIGDPLQSKVQLLALAMTGEPLLWNYNRITDAEMRILRQIADRLLHYVETLGYQPQPFRTFVAEMQRRGLYQ